MNPSVDKSFDPYQAKELDREDIQKILPHRDPFLMLDRVIELSEEKAVGVKNVGSEESYFRGHFPGNPVMPGVLIVEALAQLTGVFALSRPDYRGKFGYIAALNNVRFRGVVRPGDVLKLEVQQTKCKRKFIVASGKAMVLDKDVCEAELMLFLVDSQ